MIGVLNVIVAGLSAGIVNVPPLATVSGLGVLACPMMYPTVLSAPMMNVFSVIGPSTAIPARPHKAPMCYPLAMLSTRNIAGTAVSSLALGTAGWGPKDDVELNSLYSAYRLAGGNCIDSAHCYSFWLDRLGEPERIIGKLLRRHNDRANVVVCTKGCHPAGGDKYQRSPRFMSPEVLARDIHDSLERLQVDTIDFYFLHRDDPSIPVGEILDALHAHQQAGRIHHYAASNWTEERLDVAAAYCRSNKIPPFAASQDLYTLAHLTKSMPADIITLPAGEEAWYAKTGMPLFAYSPNANGYFNGRTQGKLRQPHQRATHGTMPQARPRVGSDGQPDRPGVPPQPALPRRCHHRLNEHRAPSRRHRCGPHSPDAAADDRTGRPVASCLGRPRLTRATLGAGERVAYALNARRRQRRLGGYFDVPPRVVRVGGPDDRGAHALVR